MELIPKITITEILNQKDEEIEGVVDVTDINALVHLNEGDPVPLDENQVNITMIGPKMISFSQSFQGASLVNILIEKILNLMTNDSSLSHRKYLSRTETQMSKNSVFLKKPTFLISYNCSQEQWKSNKEQTLLEGLTYQVSPFFFVFPNILSPLSIAPDLS